MNDISILETNLTKLQENVLIEINKTTNTPFIYKKLDIKPLTLTKTIQLLNQKGLLEDYNLTEKGKKMVHYLEFKNETISLFLNKYNIESNQEIESQLSKLDFKIIITLRNLL